MTMSLEGAALGGQWFCVVSHIWVESLPHLCSPSLSFMSRVPGPGTPALKSKGSRSGLRCCNLGYGSLFQQSGPCEHVLERSHWAD